MRARAARRDPCAQQHDGRWTRWFPHTPPEEHARLWLLGSGKTTLINRLLGRDAFDTKAVSGTGEGVHTTTRRQLISLDWAMLIDTPGDAELGLLGATDGVSDAFAELHELCATADSRTARTPRPDVRSYLALKNGALSEERYQSYLKLKKEAAFHDLTYIEKRQEGQSVRPSSRSSSGWRSEASVDHPGAAAACRRVSEVGRVADEFDLPAEDVAHFEPQVGPADGLARCPAARAGRATRSRRRPAGAGDRPHAVAEFAPHVEPVLRKKIDRAESVDPPGHLGLREEKVESPLVGGCPKDPADRHQTCAFAVEIRGAGDELEPRRELPHAHGAVVDPQGVVRAVIEIAEHARPHREFGSQAFAQHAHPAELERGVVQPRGQIGRGRPVEVVYSKAGNEEQGRFRRGTGQGEPAFERRLAHAVESVLASLGKPGALEDELLEEPLAVIVGRLVLLLRGSGNRRLGQPVDWLRRREEPPFGSERHGGLFLGRDRRQAHDRALGHRRRETGDQQCESE